METEIRSFISTTMGTQVADIFGYSTNGIPGFEIHGLGKQGKSLKEKIIYMTRLRKIRVPNKRIVVNVDFGELNTQISEKQLLWLEYPILLLYWYLIGVLPIRRLDDCIASGRLEVKGEIVHAPIPKDLLQKLSHIFNPIQMRQLKLICSEKHSCGLWNIDSRLLLEHIPNLNFK